MVGGRLVGIVAMSPRLRLSSHAATSPTGMSLCEPWSDRFPP